MDGEEAEREMTGLREENVRTRVAKVEASIFFSKHHRRFELLLLSCVGWIKMV